MNLILNSFHWRRYPAVIRVINFVTECHTVSHHGAFCFSMMHHTYKVSYIFDKRKNRDVKIDFFNSKISTFSSRKRPKIEFSKRSNKSHFEDFLWEIQTLIHSDIWMTTWRRIQFWSIFYNFCKSSPKYKVDQNKWSIIFVWQFRLRNYKWINMRYLKNSRIFRKNRFDPKVDFFKTVKVLHFLALFSRWIIWRS